MIIIERKSPLDTMRETERLSGSAFTNEAGGHKFIITCYRGSGMNTVTVPLTSGTVSGRFFRPDGTAVAITSAEDYAGIDADGRAWAILPANCYTQTGAFGLTITHVDGDVRTVIYSAAGYVRAGEASQVVDPENIINLDAIMDLIDDMEDAVDDCETAAAAANAAAEGAVENFAPDYSDLTFPVSVGQHCTHSGVYYVANTAINSSETWTAAHWTQVTTGGEISGLKGSLAAMSAASASDEGKALKAKTVSGGEVTEWEFGETAVIDGTLSQTGEAADAKAVGDVIAPQYSATATYPVGDYVLHNGTLYKCVTAVTTAASWETNADNFEAVSAAEEIEGLYLGEALTKRGTLNLLDGVYWSAGSLGSADPVPVEYGKKYTASFSAYANRVFALDASKNELGDASTDTYIKRTEVFSVWCKKWVYEVMDQSVKYIRFKQMSQPAAPYFLVEGDIDMPYPLDVSTLTAVDANRDDLRKVIFEDEKVGFDDLRADISEGVKKLGYTDKVIEAGDVQEYDAETYPLTFDEKGNVVMADASALRSGTYVMLLKANVNGLYIDKFGYNIDSGAPSGGLAGPPAIVMQTNVGHTGYVLTFRTYGSKIAGISYIYSWNTNGTFQAADSSYSWASEYAIDTLRVKRNSDSFDFIFKNTQGTVTTKHFTFAQMHVTDPDALGIAWIDKKTSAVDNQMVIMGMKVSAPASITGGGTVTSPMNGAKYDAWGDSYTQGTGTYANIIAEQTGATLTNYGVSGNTVAQMYARMQAATVDGAYVSVLCGVNDYLHDTVMATFRTSVANVCAFIAASYTSAKALWVLPPQLPDNSANTEGNTLEDYVDAIKEICAANSVPVLDMYHAGNWYGTVAAFQALYFSDSIHPSTAGHALIAGKVRKALEAL